MNQERGRLHPAFLVGWETRPWDREPDHSVSRRQKLSARGPYSAAMPVAIAESTLHVDAAIQAEAEDAVREITRFDAEVTAIAIRRAARQGDDAPTELALLGDCVTSRSGLAATR